MTFTFNTQSRYYQDNVYCVYFVYCTVHMQLQEKWERNGGERTSNGNKNYWCIDYYFFMLKEKKIHSTILK